MAKRDYYNILGVQKNASKDEIKASYKKLAKQYHPDVNKGKDSEEKFKELSEAYAVLSDDQKRAQYDQFGHDTFDQRFSQEDIFRNFDFDIFREFGNFDSIFDTFFGRRHQSSGGADVRYDLKLTFEEAAFGIEKTIDVERKEDCDSCSGTGSSDKKLATCDECNGRGQVQKTRRTAFGIFTQIGACVRCQGTGKRVTNPCKACKGSGLADRAREIKVKVPAGVDNGTTIRLSGEGEVTDDRVAGDLYIVVHVMPHQSFEREGPDIYSEKKISFSQAVLGAEVEVQTLNNKATLKIPPGTQSHTTFRLNGLGIKKLNKSGNGDFFIRVIVDIPQKLSKRQRELMEELSKEEGIESKKSGFKKFFT